MHRLPMPIRFQDLQTHFRGRVIVIWLDDSELEAAIDFAWAALLAEESRRQYFHRILPGDVAYTVPGRTETFVVQCADGQCFRLQDCTLPLLWQMVNLEREQNVQVIKLIHDDGRRQWTYCL